MMLRFDFPKTMESLFENFTASDFVPTGTSAPAMDITENENEYIVVAELPGVKKEDVKVSFENNVLTVQAERKPYELPEDARILLNEMRVREFSRSLRVPVQVDANNISAELQNGVLRIVLPRAQEARPRTIAVK
jgi:HSP20 family protein